MKVLAIFLLALTVSCTSAKPSVFKFIKSIGKELHNSVKKMMGSTPTNDDGKPSFCHKLDCPDFKTVQKIKVNKDLTIDERCYGPTGWVETGMTGSSGKSLGFRTMFKKLFNYIQGENEEKEKIEMTAPVLLSVKTADESVTMNMNFFVPPTQYDTLPKPTNKDVTIVKQNAMCVYVLSYGGWQMGYNQKLLNKVQELKNGLDKKGMENMYDDKAGFFFAGYDSPWKFWGRHNEVMILKKTQESTNNPNASTV